MLVYDATNRKSFVSVERWFNEIQQHSDNAKVMLAANKSEVTNQVRLNVEIKAILCFHLNPLTLALEIHHFYQSK